MRIQIPCDGLINQLSDETKEKSIKPQLEKRRITNLAKFSKHRRGYLRDGISAYSSLAI